MRNTMHQTRRAAALGLATAALGSAFTLGSSGVATAQPIPPSGPSQGNNANPPSGVFGSETQPVPEPHDMLEGTLLWEDMQWPNWHNIADRGWHTANAWYDSIRQTNYVQRIFTGGRYQDNEGRLRRFLNSGMAGDDSRDYTGTFQEYNTTIYTVPGSSADPRRDARRVVRAILTGDTWWTNDHYSTFNYMGRT